MTLSNFIAEASHYAASAHYRSRGVRAAGRIDSILAQQLCRQLGESCGGIDLICCPGLTCTAGLGGQGICVPQDVPCCWPPGCQICDGSA
jgi:hypothetical protein